MKKNTAVGLSLLAAFAVLTAVTSIQAYEGDRTQTAQEISDTLMQQKLKHAQDLLSALALSDFNEMIGHSRELQRISLEARWSQPPSLDYAAFGDDFRNALDRVITAAEKRNVDNAALGYVEVVLTCVRCHEIVRKGEAIARGTDPGDFGLLSLKSQNQLAAH